MRLVRADGHQQQQWALANIHTRNIARILSEHIDDDETLIREVAQILQKFDGEAYDGLAQKLDNIRAFYELDASEEQHIVPDYIIELLQALYELYHQPLHILYQQRREQIDSLRGAVVERLGLELIKPRYNENDECANSRRFVDQHDTRITFQEVDIAAISEERRQLEAYECKMKAHHFVDHDRSDLEFLYNAAKEEDYQVQVGVISLDPSKLVERRLGWLNAAPCIQSYGVDVLGELQYSPFEG